MSHTGGTKTFARYIADYAEKNGEAPDPIQLFYMLHKRRDKNKNWIDNASEQMADKISQELNHLIATHSEETLELRQQAYVAARGFETRHRVRGYGVGVTPDMVPWVVQTQPTSSSHLSRRGKEYARMESQFLELQDKYVKQQEEVERQKAESKRHEREIEELRRIISSISQGNSHQQSTSQQQSASQNHSSSQRQSPSNHQSFSEQQSPSQHTPSFHRHPPYHPVYPYPSSLQYYYPQPYQSPVYPPGAPYPHG